MKKEMDKNTSIKNSSLEKTALSISINKSRKAFCRQRVPKSSYEREATVDIDNLKTSGH